MSHRVRRTASPPTAPPAWPGPAGPTPRPRGDRVRADAGTSRPPSRAPTPGSSGRRATQKRRVMSRSSGLGRSRRSTVTGSSAMPQMGQGPARPADLRVHRARPLVRLDIRVSCRRGAPVVAVAVRLVVRPSGVGVRAGEELLPAPRRAEHVLHAIMDGTVLRSGRVDRHPAHRVDPGSSTVRPVPLLLMTGGTLMTFVFTVMLVAGMVALDVHGVNLVVWAVLAHRVPLSCDGPRAEGRLGLCARTA